MMTPALTLLRLHVEAVWHLSLPSLRYGDNDLPDTDTHSPPWRLYLAHLPGEQSVRLWRADVAPTTRQSVRERAEAALALPRDAAISDESISREVALARHATPRITSEAASRIARRITREDAEVLGRLTRYVDFYLSDECAPVYIVIEDGRIACMAHSSRRHKHVCELGIDTVPEARRRGYALAATVLWAEAVAAEGREPLYSASAENAASLALAYAAGYRPFASGVSIEG